MTVDHKFVEIPNVKEFTVSLFFNLTRKNDAHAAIHNKLRNILSYFKNHYTQRNPRKKTITCELNRSLNWRYTPETVSADSTKENSHSSNFARGMRYSETSNIHRQTLSTGKQHKPTVRPGTTLNTSALHTPQHKISN
jgi:hypothetical protein